MKWTFVLTALLLAAPAFAGDRNAVTSGNTTTYYGADGRKIGSATTTSGTSTSNTTTFYGANGSKTGSASVPLSKGRR